MTGSHMDKYRKRRIKKFLFFFGSGMLSGALFALFVIGMIPT